MLIVGIDTSGRQGSVALLRANGEEVVALEVAIISGGQYSERLVPTIAELLVRHGFERSSIGLIAVASGPGSFTGVRIAIATAKGLAEACGAAVVDISVLEATALGAGIEGEVIAAIDAQRAEIFFGEYKVEAAGPELRATRVAREGVASFAEFTLLFEPGKTSEKIVPSIVTFDEGLAARFHEAGYNSVLVARPSAENFSRIAYHKFLSGICADVAALDANYVRRSDAEIFVAPKRCAEPDRH